MKTNKPHKQYQVDPVIFDAYNKDTPIQQALGSERQSAKREQADIRSVNWVPGVSGWRLTPRGLELGGTFDFTSSINVSGDIVFQQDVFPTARSIRVQDQATANTNGNDLFISSGLGKGTGYNGDVDLFSPSRTTASPSDTVPLSLLNINADRAIGAKLLTITNGGNNDIAEYSTIVISSASLSIGALLAGDGNLVGGNIQVTDETDYASLRGGGYNLAAGSVSNGSSGATGAGFAFNGGEWFGSQWIGGDLLIQAGTGNDVNGVFDLSQAEGFYRLGGPNARGILDVSGLTISDKTFTFPNQSGTLALTADAYTDEKAQDAVGGMLDASLTYIDGTPLLKITDTYKRKSLFDHYADVGNVGTGEDDLYSDTIAASQLANNGEKIQAQYNLTFVTSATATRQVRAYFGGTLILDTGTLTFGSTGDANIWVTIIRESSTVVRCMVEFTVTGLTLQPISTYTRITGLTLSNTNILKITGEAAGVGAATNDVVAKMASVEWLAAA